MLCRFGGLREDMWRRALPVKRPRICASRRGRGVGAARETALSMEQGVSTVTGSAPPEGLNVGKQTGVGSEVLRT